MIVLGILYIVVCAIGVLAFCKWRVRMEEKHPWLHWPHRY